jgi:acetyl esterase/lipase
MRRFPASIVTVVSVAIVVLVTGSFDQRGAAGDHARVRLERSVATGQTTQRARTAATVAPPKCAPSSPAVPPGGSTAPATYRYGPDPAHVLDLYLPPPDAVVSAPAPLILFFHSGGWIGGSRTNVPDFVTRQIGHGWAVASADYRFAPAAPFPAAIEDAKWALRWLKANASNLGIRPDCIVAAGTSAGGHIAAMLAVTKSAFEPTGLPAELASLDEKVIGLIDVVGPTDLGSLWREPTGYGPAITSSFLQCTSIGCDPNLLAASNPITYVAPDDPPALLVYGGQDTLVTATENGQALADAWAEVAGPAVVTYERVPDQGHNIDFVPGGGLDWTLTQFLAGVRARP